MDSRLHGAPSSPAHASGIHPPRPAGFLDPTLLVNWKGPPARRGGRALGGGDEGGSDGCLMRGYTLPSPTSRPPAPLANLSTAVRLHRPGSGKDEGSCSSRSGTGGGARPPPSRGRALVTCSSRAMPRSPCMLCSCQPELLEFAFTTMGLDSERKPLLEAARDQNQLDTGMASGTRGILRAVPMAGLRGSVLYCAVTSTNSQPVASSSCTASGTAVQVGTP